MNTYNLTIWGKKFQMSKKTYICMVIPLLAFLIGYVWCMTGGIWRFGENYFHSGLMTVIPAIFIFGSFKINDVHYGILPESNGILLKNKVTKVMTRIVCWSAVFYYLYTVFN